MKMSVSIFSPIAKKTPAQSTNRDLGVSFYVTNDLQFKYPLVICYIAIENDHLSIYSGFTH